MRMCWLVVIVFVCTVETLTCEPGGSIGAWRQLVGRTGAFHWVRQLRKASEKQQGRRKVGKPTGKNRRFAGGRQRNA
jgi:hypothetical protein